MNISRRTLTAVILVPFAALLGAGCYTTDESGSPEEQDVEDFIAEAQSPLYGPGEAGEVLYDGPGAPTFTRCDIDQNTHCCPKGFAMAGLHVGANLFRCTRTSSVGSGTAEYCVRDGQYAPTTTKWVGAVSMHTCPDGNYMRGANLGANMFVCCGDTFVHSANRTPDYNTSVDGIMHTCPWPGLNVMAGFNQGSNVLACTTWTPPHY